MFVLYKEKYLLNFHNLITEIHYNFFNNNSVAQLFIDLEDLYKNDKMDKFILLSKYLKIYKIFNKFTVDRLGFFFALSAGNAYKDPFVGIINCCRFRESSIDQIGTALGLASDMGHLNYERYN